MAQQTMAAIQVHAYGGADRLTLDQIPRPEPGSQHLSRDNPR